MFKQAAAIASERTLFTGTVADASVVLGMLVAAAVAALGLTLGTIAIRKASV